MKKKKIVIIGAGFGGLSAAALLAKDGFQVKVLEKNLDIGGRARVWKKDGFVFDLGPSWYTMPDVFERFFSLFDKKPSDFYKLKRLDPSYRIYFGTQEKLDLPAQYEQSRQLFESLEKGSAEKLDKYLQQSEYQYSQAMEHFIYRSYPTLLSMFDLQLVGKVQSLHLLEDMDTFTKRFFNNEKLRKILLYTLVFLGGAPKKTPALYALMSYIDFKLGIWYPMGGIGTVVNAIADLGKSYGATINTSEPVTHINVDNNGIATSVSTTKSTYDADLVISNADYAFTEMSLLGPRWQTYSNKYWQKRTVAPSAFLIYLGINKRIKGLNHHTLFFHHDWVDHFNQIFDNPGWPDKPSYYVCTPSKTDPIMAPKGQENIFILVPIASGLEDTSAIRKAYRDKIITDMENILGEKFEQNIILERIYSVNDFDEDYNAYQGTALGLTHTLFQTAYFRPHHQSKKVKNLYFTGQFTHPGIGVPITLISSQIVRDLINRDN